MKKRNKSKEKNEAILKSDKIFGIMGSIGLSAAAFGVFCVIGTLCMAQHAIKIAEDCGYNEFNAIYKVEKIENLSEQFENKEISPSEYADKINNIKNYSVTKYMKENSSPEKLKDFENLNAAALAVGIGGVSSAFAGLVSFGSGFFISCREMKKREKELKIAIEESKDTKKKPEVDYDEIRKQFRFVK